MGLQHFESCSIEPEMSVATKTAKLAALAKAAFSRTQYLFVISHMRSRSSLLSHILGSHPQVIGYSELHQSYHRWNDLLWRRTLAHLERRGSLRDKYLLDKVLHNQHPISPGILGAPNTRCIFLLREPESTLKSIRHMSSLTGAAQYKDFGKNLAYYRSRLALMSDYASKCPTNGCFVESDNLIDDTDAVLHRLTQWLGLTMPLQPEYSIFTDTGRPVKGDPSDNIKSGKVLKTAGPQGVEVPPALLEEAHAAHEACKRQLKNAFGGAS